MSVPIPCRHCGKLSIQLTLNEGSQNATCPRCSKVTEVRVGLEGGALRVRTARGSGGAQKSK
jgi:phage FluMu protein Com